MIKVVAQISKAIMDVLVNEAAKINEQFGEKIRLSYTSHHIG